MEHARVVKVVAHMAVSLDGFISDRNGDNRRLYANQSELREGKLLRDFIARTGAVVMGRRSYELAQGDFTDYEYQVPLFVVTHDVPSEKAKGENGKLQLHFVTDGALAAIEQAKTEAALTGRDVLVVGGVDVIHQLLRQGHIDELTIGIVPVLLGAGGLRLFDGNDELALTLQHLETIDAPGRTDIRYQVLRPG